MEALAARLNEIAERVPWPLLALKELAERKEEGGIKIHLDNGNGNVGFAAFKDPSNGKPGVIAGNPTEPWILAHELGHLWDYLYGNHTLDRSKTLDVTLSELAAIYHEMAVTGETNFWAILKTRYGTEGPIARGMAALKGVMSRRAAKNKVSFEEYQEDLARRLNGPYWEDPTLIAELSAIYEELEKEVGTPAADDIVQESLHRHISIAGREGYEAVDYVTPVLALCDKFGISHFSVEVQMVVLKQLIEQFGSIEAVEKAFNSKDDSPNKKRLNEIIDSAKAMQALFDSWKGSKPAPPSDTNGAAKSDTKGAGKGPYSSGPLTLWKGKGAANQ